MDLLGFLNNFSDKPKKHGEIWFFILCRVNQKIYVNEIMKTYNISKASLYRIFNTYNTHILNGSEYIVFNIKNSCIYSNSVTKINASNKRISNKAKETIVDEAKEVDIYKEIIEYLNQKSGKRFSYKTQTTKRFINARLKEGYIYTDFKKVIDIKCTKWLNSSMEDYLRPQTLFSNKFEGYINETLNNNKKDTVDKANDTINKAKQFNWEFNS